MGFQKKKSFGRRRPFPHHILKEEKKRGREGREGGKKCPFLLPSCFRSSFFLSPLASVGPAQLSKHFAEDLSECWHFGGGEKGGKGKEERKSNLKVFLFPKKSVLHIFQCSTKGHRNFTDFKDLDRYFNISWWYSSYLVEFLSQTLGFMLSSFKCTLFFSRHSFSSSYSIQEKKAKKSLSENHPTDRPTDQREEGFFEKRGRKVTKFLFSGEEEKGERGSRRVRGTLDIEVRFQKKKEEKKSFGFS